jgi:TPR repeat protein
VTDEEEAMKWHRKAAEGGSEYAIFQFGWAFELSEMGLVTKMEKPLKWHQKAAGAEAAADGRC